MHNCYLEEYVVYSVTKISSPWFEFIGSETVVSIFIPELQVLVSPMELVCK